MTDEHHQTISLIVILYRDTIKKVFGHRGALQEDSTSTILTLPIWGDQFLLLF